MELLRVLIRNRDDFCANPMSLVLQTFSPLEEGARGVAKLVGVVQHYSVVIHYILRRRSVFSTAGSFELPETIHGEPSRSGGCNFWWVCSWLRWGQMKSDDTEL